MRSDSAENPPPACASLPVIPGGWETKTIALAGRDWSITLPADPDAFLDDPQTVAEHERTGYMPYWQYLWPSALTMAQLVSAADWPRNNRVLEIGCGIGVVGLAALAKGYSVIFSDYRPESVILSLHNAHRNGFTHCGGLCFDWNHPPSAKVPIILGCEVIYEKQNHGLVLKVIERVLCPGGLCWIGDPGRHTADEFTARARKEGYAVTLFDKKGTPVSDHRPGEFRLIELRKV